MKRHRRKRVFQSFNATGCDLKAGKVCSRGWLIPLVPRSGQTDFPQEMWDHTAGRLHMRISHWKKSVFIFNSLNGPNLCYTVRFCLVFFYMNEINTWSMFSHIMCLWRASDRMSGDPQTTCCNIGWRCEAAAIYLLFKSSLVTVINFFKGYLASLFIIAAVASFY